MRTTYYSTPLHLFPAMSTEARKHLVRRGAVLLREVCPSINALVVVGVSGIVFGTSLADAMDLPLIVIRKANEPQPHSWNKVEGPDKDDFFPDWVFVDDCVATGATWRHAFECMTLHYSCNQRCLGLLLYQCKDTNLVQLPIHHPVYSLC